MKKITTNCLLWVLCFLVTTSVYAGYDLTVTNGNVSSTNVSAGSTITVTGFVKNLGSDEVSETRITFILSQDQVYDPGDLYLASKEIEHLSSGEQVGKTSQVIIPSSANGSYYILFIVDLANEVLESNESNNLLVRSISVSATSPDLAITNFVVPPSAAIGQSIGIGLYATNLNTNQPPETIVPDSIFQLKIILTGPQFKLERFSTAGTKLKRRHTLPFRPRQPQAIIIC